MYQRNACELADLQVFLRSVNPGIVRVVLGKCKEGTSGGGVVRNC